MHSIFIPNKRHLGDVITTLNLLHSRNLETNEQFIVFGPLLIVNLIEIFNYNLIYAGLTKKDLINNISITDFLPLKKCDVSFLVDGMFNAKLPKYLIKKVQLPSPKIQNNLEQKNILCFQFDMRSSGHNKKLVNSEESQKILARFRGDIKEMIGIGGLETVPYLNHEFKLGDSMFLFNLLKSSKKFVGIDSGISHLAGTAKIPGNIVITNSVVENFKGIALFYSLMYPTLTCHRRYEDNYPLVIPKKIKML